jgi:hypothetical protein
VGFSCGQNLEHDSSAISTRFVDGVRVQFWFHRVCSCLEIDIRLSNNVVPACVSVLDVSSLYSSSWELYFGSNGFMVSKGISLPTSRLLAHEIMKSSILNNVE